MKQIDLLSPSHIKIYWSEEIFLLFRSCFDHLSNPHIHQHPFWWRIRHFQQSSSGNISAHSSCCQFWREKIFSYLPENLGGFRWSRMEKNFLFSTLVQRHWAIRRSKENYWSNLSVLFSCSLALLLSCSLTLSITVCFSFNFWLFLHVISDKIDAKTLLNINLDMEDIRAIMTSLKIKGGDLLKIFAAVRSARKNLGFILSSFLFLE